MTPTLTPTTDEFGPQGEHVIALIGRLRNLTPEEVSSFRAAAWAAARAAAWAAEEQWQTERLRQYLYGEV